MKRLLLVALAILSMENLGFADGELRNFFIGSWFSKPEFVKFYQTYLYIEININRDGAVRFRSLGVIEDNNGRKTAAVIAEKNEKYQFVNDEIQFSNKEMGGTVYLKRIDDHSIRMICPHNGVDSTVLINESLAPWSKINVEK